MKNLFVLLLACVMLAGCTIEETEKTTIAVSTTEMEITTVTTTTTAETTTKNTEITVTGLDGEDLSSEIYENGLVYFNDMVYTRKSGSQNWSKITCGDVVEEEYAGIKLTVTEAKTVYMPNGVQADEYIYENGEQDWVESNIKLSGNIVLTGKLTSDENGVLTFAPDSHWLQYTQFRLVSPVKENDTIPIVLGNISEYPDISFNGCYDENGRINIVVDIEISDISLSFSSYDGEAVCDYSAKMNAIHRYYFDFDLNLINELYGVWEAETELGTVDFTIGTPDVDYYIHHLIQSNSALWISNLYEHDGKIYMFHGGNAGEGNKYVYDRNNPDEILCYNYISGGSLSCENDTPVFIYKRVASAEPYSLIGEITGYTDLYLNTECDYVHDSFECEIDGNIFSNSSWDMYEIENNHINTLDICAENRLVFTDAFTVYDKNHNTLTSEAIIVTYEMTRNTEGEWELTEWQEHNPFTDTEPINPDNVDLSLMEHFYGMWSEGFNMGLYAIGTSENSYTDLLNGEMFLGLFETEKAYYMYLGYIQTADTDKYVIYKSNPDRLYYCYGYCKNEKGFEFIRTGYYNYYGKADEAKPYELIGKVTNYTYLAIKEMYDLNPEYRWLDFLEYEGETYHFAFDENDTLDICEENRLVFTRLYDNENSDEQVWLTYEIVRDENDEWRVNVLEKHNNEALSD